MKRVKTFRYKRFIVPCFICSATLLRDVVHLKDGIRSPLGVVAALSVCKILWEELFCFKRFNLCKEVRSNTYRCVRSSRVLDLMFISGILHRKRNSDHFAVYDDCTIVPSICLV
jgi:hypothetical protein